ncbi:MAG TPA: hypothetical protein VG758_22905 [Hyphomicrobiaceae bacterium]|jgi:hypothetical protein|nr:hypothetical protein [Hyphomicrobiaceae bacterium]
MANLPKPYPFAGALRRAFKQDITEVGDDPQRLGEMLCGSAMICVIEVQKRYGPETAHAALAELRKYVDKLDRMFTDPTARH